MMRWLKDPTRHPVTLIDVLLLIACVGCVFTSTHFFFQGERDNAIFFALMAVAAAVGWIL